MYIGRFAEGYRKNDIDLAQQDPSLIKSAGRSFMEGPNKWSHIFGDLTQDYLSGEIDDPDTAKVNLIRYASDSVQQSLRSTRGHMQEYAYHFSSLSPWLNSLNFHTINGELLRYWDRLIDPENQEAPDELDIAVMQARLSIQSLELVAIRRSFQEKSRQTGVSSPIDSSFVGQITENDAGVGMLEFIKNLPPDMRERLLLLPAAHGFDYGAAADRSIDYILIDQEAHQARGIQVTTNAQAIKRYSREAYDPTFVTELDGVEDLRNFTTQSPQGGPVRKKVLPGLMSADFILNNPIVGSVAGSSKVERLNGYQGRLIEARKVAHELFPATNDPSRIPHLANTMGERILNDLYTN